MIVNMVPPRGGGDVEMVETVEMVEVWLRVLAALHTTMTTMALAEVVATVVLAMVGNSRDVNGNLANVRHLFLLNPANLVADVKVSKKKFYFSSYFLFHFLSCANQLCLQYK